MIEKYRRHKEADWPLHRQFLLKYEAVNEYRRHGNMLRCRVELGNALTVTFHEWGRMQILNYYLCSQELHLLILIAFFMMPENEVRALWILTETAIYLEERYYEEEKVKLLPQCMWLLAEHSKRHGDWEKVEEYSRRGVECLTRNGALPLLRELLELRIESLRNLGSDMCEIETLQNQLDSLVAVLARYADWVLRMDDLSKLHYFYHEEEVSLDYEMLRDIRKNQGISQGEVQSCTQGSLSRIENGKQAPSKRHVMEIAEELGVNKSYYISRVQSEDYDLYELCHWKNQANFHREWERSLELLDKLEAALDMSIPINWQYIEVSKVLWKKREKIIEPEMALKQLEVILGYTMPDYCEKKLRIPSREEFIILNQMAVLMGLTGKIENGLKLHKFILNIFQDSRVDEQYHTNSMLLLYMDYGEMLETIGELELAEEMDVKGIQLDIWCGSIDIVGKILANLAYVYDKSENETKRVLRRNYLINAYQLCVLLKQTIPAKVIKECYQLMFGQDIF